jgi:histidyl-tRNA synthetase
VSQKLSGVKGMRDLFGEELENFLHIERHARELFRRFGYGELRTPMLEDTSLFVRSVGEETDIVGKEMYTFEDKAARSLTLRPEGTAPAVRAYIEHSLLNQEPVTRWFYIGPMFRYERMKTGRYRQFYQIGAEAFGAKEPAQDVELMDFVHQLLTALELPNVQLQINSLGDAACRPAYQAKLIEYLTSHKEQLCADCQVRLGKNPLRVLDCKNEQCQAIARGAPEVTQFLCEACQAHFSAVQRKLTALKIPFGLNPRMVRGLDYYTRTAFEFIADDPVLGTASAVGGGGRYDNLVKGLGGPDVPAVGFGLGLDRLALLVGKQAKSHAPKPDLFVATVDEAAQDKALELVSGWRKAGLIVDFDTRGGSLKSQMKRADKSGARYTLVLGGDELASGRGNLKPMQGGEPIQVSFEDVPRSARA